MRQLTMSPAVSYHLPRERSMGHTRIGALAVAAAVLAAAPAPAVRAQREAAPVTIDNDDIGGVVTGGAGPEAGVWVIAETTDLPTRVAKIVVTDDQNQKNTPPNSNHTY